MRVEGDTQLLLEIARAYQDEEFDRAVGQYRRPEVFYYFSSMRQNLISWYDQFQNKRILEVGSECGTLTSILARQASHVTCLEVLEELREVGQFRNQQYDNVEYVDKKMEELVSGGKSYDCITVLSDFAQIGQYLSTKGPNSQQRFLTLAAELLSEGGKLILACENRSGMKYFAGQREHYSQRYFGGFLGEQVSEEAQIYTGVEYERILQKACPGWGLSRYYPYPDHRFPMAIYSDEYLPKRGELNQNGDDPIEPRVHLFNEDQVFDLIVEQGLFPNFTNSYLYIVEKQAEEKGAQ